MKLTGFGNQLIDSDALNERSIALIISSSVAAKLSKLREDFTVIVNSRLSSEHSITRPSGNGALSGEMAESVLLASSSD